MTGLRKKFTGGALVVVGYILSPLSWWNDLFINIPLAYGFGFLFGLISKSLFMPMLIVGYWITNIAGFIMMHKGAKGILKSKQENSGYGKKEIVKDLIFSLIYTALIVILINVGWLKFPTEYFN